VASFQRQVTHYRFFVIKVSGKHMVLLLQQEAELVRSHYVMAHQITSLNNRGGYIAEQQALYWTGL
jgi:hypothetical protein